MANGRASGGSSRWRRWGASASRCRMADGRSSGCSSRWRRCGEAGTSRCSSVPAAVAGWAELPEGAAVESRCPVCSPRTGARLGSSMLTCCSGGGTPVESMSVSGSAACSVGGAGPSAGRAVRLRLVSGSLPGRSWGSDRCRCRRRPAVDGEPQVDVGLERRGRARQAPRAADRCARLLLRRQWSLREVGGRRSREAARVRRPPRRRGPREVARRLQPAARAAWRP